MNYFELHVGDYDAATAHLSMLEDAAYGRMLRVYYRTESPLPKDIKQVCRLVRAQSKPERDAVEQVLQEFFELADDGWHQARADAEIARFQEGEPEREARKANEETRLQQIKEDNYELKHKIEDIVKHYEREVELTKIKVSQLYEADPTRHGHQRLRAQYTNALELVSAFAREGKLKAALAAKPDTRRGASLYATCAACHGPEGKGNPAMGAPNLTDDT